ncbi:cupin domain protein [Asticcacaulis biprosthecium C19]|uniref:Cupin domain protein n=1 Tax=Asticcacaulis biprosthecium C19 TaxID=715226 RepID=F4QT97_9CAUL|nr:cupin domain-containing protein [Asticcacaulis biprosthecium]EGF89967.1 cupin domain protein [Asticcacaulis biprosthecium C19]
MIFNLFSSRKKSSSMIKKHRRIVTGHDARGRAVVERDELIEGYVTPTKDAVLTSLWATDSFPCDNTDRRDGRDLITGLVCPSGSVLRIVDMLPHSRSPFHRTTSLDYAIVVSGEVDMELDDGLMVSMKAGDVAMQRGTIHAWVNRSEAPCSIVFVLLGAHPVVIDGQPLEPTPMHGIT